MGADRMGAGCDTTGFLARLVHFDITGARSDLALIDYWQHRRTAAGVSRISINGPAGVTAG